MSNASALYEKAITLLKKNRSFKRFEKAVKFRHASGATVELNHVKIFGQDVLTIYEYAVKRIEVQDVRLEALSGVKGAAAIQFLFDVAKERGDLELECLIRVGEEFINGKLAVNADGSVAMGHIKVYGGVVTAARIEQFWIIEKKLKL